MPKFCRTELDRGKPITTLFATGENTFIRTIEALDEIIVNNVNNPPIKGPATLAKDSLAILLSQVRCPKHRADKPIDEDTADANGAPEAA